MWVYQSIHPMCILNITCYNIHISLAVIRSAVQASSTCVCSVDDSTKASSCHHPDPHHADFFFFNTAALVLSHVEFLAGHYVV